MLAQLLRSEPAGWQNWCGTVRCQPSHCARPISLEQIQSEVLRANEEGERLRVIGSGHSYSPLCWTDDNHMSLEHFEGIEAVDMARRRVWVRAGTRLSRLAELLADRGLALDIAPDNDALTIGGAVATASHGSGGAFGNLSTYITALRIVRSNGSVQNLNPSDDPDAFAAAAVSLGALGVVTHIELQCVDDYRLDVRVEATTFNDMLARINTLRREHRNVTAFWHPYNGSVLLRTADVTTAYPAQLSPARRALLWRWETMMQSPVVRRSPRLVGRLGRMVTQWVSSPHEVLRAREAYRLAPRQRFQMMEYALPAAAARPALRGLARLVNALDLRVRFPIGVRFVQGDKLWLSPNYERDSVCIAVPGDLKSGFLDQFEPVAELFERHDGRPHWGTVHSLGAEQLTERYPRFEDFRALRRSMDPHGLFLNLHLAHLFGETLR